MSEPVDVFNRLARLLERETLISERAAILFDMTGPKAAYRWMKVGPPEPVLRLVEFMEEVPFICWPTPMRQRFMRAQALGQRKGPQSTTPAARARRAPTENGRRTRGRKVVEASGKSKAGARP